MGDACLHDDMGVQSEKEEFTILVTGFGVSIFIYTASDLLLPVSGDLYPATEAGNQARAATNASTKAPSAQAISD